ncbi:MORN-repeat protein [Faustovirus]|nr:MORN-repeat protein [Faustovirus]
MNYAAVIAINDVNESSSESMSDSSFDEPIVDIYDLTKCDDKKVPRSGVKTTLYADGSRESEYGFKIQDGAEIKHGYYTMWWPCGGSRQITASYKDNQLHGTYTEYYPNGKHKFTTQYIHGNCYGIGVDVVEYYDSGTVARTYCEYMAGKYHGKYHEYYPDGSKKITTYYVGNQYHGTYTSWWPNGNKQIEAVYTHGKLHGIKYEYRNDGRLRKYGQYVDGLPHKTHITLHSTGAGNQKYERNYNSRGQLHGRSYTYDIEGNWIATYNYHNGQLHGRTKRVVKGANGDAKVVSEIYHKGQLKKPKSKSKAAGCPIM